jgi:prolyl-tRNA synthetase
MRWSHALIPTLKELPSDAEVVSHQLMVRAGLIRKLAAGVFTWLPLGQRCISRITRIIREEMDAIDSQEVFMPVLQPAELWQESGRWEAFGAELMRIHDRHERPFALGPTHEEVITTLTRNILRSYRQLPQTLYQIQTKFRDEIRPRFGVMRAREFTMKDAYSFHTDEASLDETYRAMARAYETILERCGLEYRMVEADTGVIGGAESHEFMVLAENGESEILSCDRCDYAANAERAVASLQTPANAKPAAAPEEIATPGKRSVDEVTGFLQVPAHALGKTLLLRVNDADVAVVVPGDRDLNEAKLASLTASPNLRMLRDDEIEPLTGAAVGFAGPVGLPPEVTILVDTSLQGVESLITGANKTDVHLRSVVPQRDFTVQQYADLVLARAGDRCPRCQGTLQSSRGIETGHIFKLGTKYSEKMNASYLDENGSEKPYVMGCYGFGVTRLIAAAIEQNHDADGIRWPAALAPFDILLVPLNVDHAESMQLATSLYDELRRAGHEVLLDDRDLRPGAKFKDADLIGIPTRVTIGERGLRQDQIEVRDRRSGEVHKVARADLLQTLLHAD